MATLKDYFRNEAGLVKMVNQYQLEFFIETGTGMGDTVEFAKAHFKEVHSIEIYPDLCRRALGRFHNERHIHIHEGHSTEMLALLIDIHRVTERTLFFLDAHFPGADYGFQRYTDEINQEINTPLRDELKVLYDHKDTSEDIIICDDLWLYEDNLSWGAGDCPLPEESIPRNFGIHLIDYARELFGETHNIMIDPRFQGFLVLIPK